MNRAIRGVLGALAAACWLGTNATYGDDWLVPISANSPHVVVSITDERKRDDTDFFAANTDFGVGNDPDKTSPVRILPTNGPPHYDVFIFDTGSPAHIMSYATTAEFDIALAGRRGTNIIQVGGAGGEFVDAFPSDPIAIYVAGFGAVNSTSPTLNVDTAKLRGQYNVSVLNGDFNTENPEVDLPNLVGTPIASQYTTVIEYSKPKMIEVDGAVRRSPEVTLLDLGAVERPTRRLGLSFQSGQVLPTPAFVPDLGNPNFNDLGDNPSSPTNTGWFFLDADVQNNGVRRSQLEMLFDTGAQGSFVSEQVAATLGFDVELDDPDFVVRIAGVTGTSEEVPGFIAEEFTLPGTGGGLSLQNVPLIVFNITDPRDAFSTLPGLIGMNIFADRDLILNPQAGNAYLGVSDPVLEAHRWSSDAAVGQWGTAENWSEPGVPAIPWTAIASNLPGMHQTARVGEDSTVGALIVSGASGTMAVDISSNATLRVFGTAIVEDDGRIDVAGTLAPLSVEIRGGEIAGLGTVEGEVLSQGRVAPAGDGQTGTLTFDGSFDQLQEGSLEIELGGTEFSAESQQYDRVLVTGASTIAGTLDLAPLDGYVDPSDPGTLDRFTVFIAEGQLFGVFDDVLYAGESLEHEFSVGNSFRDHVGDGLFRSVSYAGNEVLVTNLQAFPGDTDGDGNVQFSDFLKLSSNFGAAGDWTEGDFTGDGLIRFPDFLALSSNYNASAAAGAATAAIPEPSSWSLLVVAGLAFLRRRRG